MESRNIPSCRPRLVVAVSACRRVPTLRLVDVGEPAQSGDDVDAVTVTEHARHCDGAGELLEVLGCRFVGHVVESDEGVSRSGLGGADTIDSASRWAHCGASTARTGAPAAIGHRLGNCSDRLNLKGST